MFWLLLLFSLILQGDPDNYTPMGDCKNPVDCGPNVPPGPDFDCTWDGSCPGGVHDIPIQWSPWRD